MTVAQMEGRATYVILGRYRASFQGCQPEELAWFLLEDGSLIKVLASRVQAWWDSGHIRREVGDTLQETG